MKIRTGFVANSSTSSFAMHGVCVDLPKYIETEDENEDDEIDYYEMAEKVGVSLHHPYDNYYIGLEFIIMEKDQTRRQFEEITEKKVNEFLDKINYKGNRYFNYYEEAWRDG